MARRKPTKPPADPERPSLGAAVKDLRARLGLTQRALAERLGVPQSSIYRWESGIVNPNGAHLQHLHDLARAHGLASGLLGDPDPEPASTPREKVVRATLALIEQEIAFCAALEEARGEEFGAEVWEILGDTVTRHRERLAAFLLRARRMDRDDFNFWQAVSLLKVFAWRPAARRSGSASYVDESQLAPSPDRFSQLG